MTDTRRAHARAFLAEPPKARHVWAERHYSYDYDVEDNGMTYFIWHDLDPKKTDEKKRHEACARYMIRFGVWPSNVYTHADQASVKGVIAPGALWLGPVEE